MYVCVINEIAWKGLCFLLMLIQYGQSKLYEIRQQVQSNRKSKLLSLDTLKLIRRSRLNKRGKRAGKNCNKQKYQELDSTEQNGVKFIKNESEKIAREHTSIVLINAQSIKNKDILLAEYIHDLM